MSYRRNVKLTLEDALKLLAMVQSFKGTELYNEDHRHSKYHRCGFATVELHLEQEIAAVRKSQANEKKRKGLA